MIADRGTFRQVQKIDSGVYHDTRISNTCPDDARIDEVAAAGLISTSLGTRAGVPWQMTGKIGSGVPDCSSGSKTASNFHYSH
jgi:hypothetical protein